MFSCHHEIISNVNSKVVINNTDNPHKKITSAVRSYFSDFSDRLLIERNEKKQLDIKQKIAVTAISSITDSLLLPKTLKDVRSMKQIPRRFAEALRMCGDFS